MRAVPHQPLLAVALFVIVPAMTMAVYDTGILRTLSISVMLLVVIVAIIDMLISRQRTLRLDCEAPAILRCTKGRELELPLTFINRGENLKWLRYGLTLSRFFRAKGAVVGRLNDLESGKSRTVSYPLVPLKRGQFFLEQLHVETPSALHLWLMRRHYPIDIEVRVYPDLSRDRKRLSSLFLNRGNEGTHVVRQVGKGRDFEQLREYQPGDDYVDIDWKATARRRMPVTRTYQIERTQEVYVIVDHSRLSAREIRVPMEEVEGEWLESEESAGGEYLVTTQLERFLHCSLVMASVAERQGDLFGFISFADKVDRFIRSRNGKEHYNIVRDALYTLEPKSVTPDFEQLMIALRQRLTRRALLVMLVDLSDPLTAEHFYESLPLISRQHLVLVNMIRPESAHPLFSRNVEPESTSEVYECLGGHFQWQELRETGKLLSNLGVDLSVPDHEELCTDAVTRYLNVKRRQLL